MIEPPVCFRCGLPKDSSSCPDCRDREFAFRRAAGAGVFDGVLREAIHGLKYRSQIALADPLAEVMARGYAGTGLAGAAEVAVPIPIHHSRKLDRGFNQAEELALRFCRRVGLPLETGALIKHRETKHQVNLPHELRAKNVEGAFRVRDARPVMRKRILLIDDVFTTGSTLNEAAKVLKESGSGEVYAYTLARSL